MKRGHDEDDEGGVDEDNPGREHAESESEEGAIANEVGISKSLSSRPDPLSKVYAGTHPSVTLKPEMAKTLRVSDVSELVTWVLTPTGSNPRWAFIRNKPMVTKVVMVLAPGLCEHRVANSAELLPNIRNLLGKGIATNHDNATSNEITLARTVLNSVRLDGPNGGIAKKKTNEKTKTTTPCGSKSNKTTVCIPDTPADTPADQKEQEKENTVL